MVYPVVYNLSINEVRLIIVEIVISPELKFSLDANNNFKN